MNVTLKPSKQAAPGPYLGFALQPVRLCYHLLTCPPEAKVSLEYQDDVAVHLLSGEITLEQAKSALKQNPLSDWADDLWKTFASWLDRDYGKLSILKTRFQIYVTPTREGKWSKDLNDAKTAEEVKALRAAIAKKYSKLTKPPACDKVLQRFLSATDDEVVAIVTRFSILSEDDDPIEPLRTLVRPTVPEPLIDLICQAGVGMAKEQADSLLRKGKIAILDGDAFKTQFINFVQRTNLPGFLTSFAPPPVDAEIAAIAAKSPNFLRQLEIIDVSDDDKLNAVSDFLRASADKSIWAERGLVFEDSLREWDNDLVKRHGFISGEVDDLHKDKGTAVVGRLIYRRCAQHQAPLDGRVVPSHFVHGCFNDLAESMRLGWHPEYRQILGGKKK